MGHRPTFASIFLQRRYCQTCSGYPRVGFCPSTGRCTGESSTRHRLFPGANISPSLERKVPDFNSPTVWPPNSPDLNPVDCSIWSVLQEKVYRSIIPNVNELEMPLIDEWGRFDQSIVDAAIAASGVVVSALVSVERGTITKHKVSAILSCIYQKLLTCWK